MQALLGGFDTQIKSGQQILAEVFQDVMSLCFEMDEKLFPGKKTASGLYQGAPYKLEYDSATAINKDYSCTVRYGLMSGLDPSRALIFSLQALQANLISRDFVMQELPWSVNVSKERERIDIEKMRDSLNGALNALSGAIPQMASQGQDPSDIVNKLAQVIDKRRKGIEIETAVMEIFVPPAPAPTTAATPVNPLEALMAGQGQSQPAPGQSAPVEAQAQTSGAPVEAMPGATPTPETAPTSPDIRSILAQLGG
jgi:hypothetical protein